MFQRAQHPDLTLGTIVADGAAGVNAPARREFAKTTRVGTSAGAWSLRVHDSFEIAEEDWRALREAGAIITPYQEYDFLHAWYECLGRAEGTGLRIVVGRDTRGRAAFLWPLGKCNCYGLPTLGWLGGKHANYTMGIYSPDAIRALQPGDWRALLKAAIAAAGADLAVLHNQPFAYGGQENPLLCTHTAKSAGPCNTIRLGHDPEALLARLRNRCSRKKIRRNLRRMEEEIGPVELVRASSQEEVTTTLNALRAHKSQLGVVRPDRTLFANPGVVRFLDRAAVFRNFDVDSGVEYFYLRAGEHIVATFGCAVSGKRAAGMFISIDADNFAHCSPGEVLITRLLEHYSERGFRALDLGVGSGEYKRRWCHDNEPLFDSIVAANWRGQLVASPLNRLILMAKNAVKASDRLSRIVQGAMIVLSGRA